MNSVSKTRYDVPNQETFSLNGRSKNHMSHPSKKQQPCRCHPNCNFIITPHNGVLCPLCSDPFWYFSISKILTQINSNWNLSRIVLDYGIKLSEGETRIYFKIKTVFIFGFIEITIIINMYVLYQYVWIPRIAETLEFFKEIPKLIFNGLHHSHITAYDFEC